MQTRRQFLTSGFRLSAAGIFVPIISHAQVKKFKRIAAVTIPSAGGGASVAYDTSIDTSNSGTGTTLTLNITVANNSNRVLYVGVGTGRAPGSDLVTSVVSDVDGAFTEVGQKDDGTFVNSQIWRLTNPTVGAHVITVTLSNLDKQYSAAAISLYNVNQTTPNDIAVTASGSSTGPTASVDLASTDMALGYLATDSQTGLSVSVGTERQEEENVAGDSAYSLATNTGTGSTAITWIQLNTGWAVVAIAVNSA